MTLLTSMFVSKQRLSVNTDDAFLSLFKGKGLNNMPVFDLWIFDNGLVLYKGIENVEKIGISKTKMPIDTVTKIKRLIDQVNNEEVGDSKGRDSALSLIKYKSRKIVFQSSRVRGNLLELNNVLEAIAELINKEN